MSGTMVWMFAALVGELVLLMLVLLSVSWLRHRAARKRDIKAMATLAARVRKSRTERTEKLQGFVKEKLDLAEDAQAPLVAALSHAELTLLQKFLAMYRDRDAVTAAQFDRAVYTALTPYQQLAVSVDGPVDREPAEVEVEPVDTGELEALRKENERLSDELKITMETMSRMLNEYSTMFSGSEPVAVPPIAATTPSAATDKVAVETQAQTAPVADADADLDADLDTDLEVIVDVVEGAADVADEAQPDVERQPADVADASAVDDLFDQAVGKTDRVSSAAEGTSADDDVPPVSPDELDAILEQALDAGTDELADRAAGMDESSRFDAVDQDGQAVLSPAVVEADVATEADPQALFDGVAAAEPEIDKGMDIDEVSELLVAGETEFVTPDGAGIGASDQDGGLLDSSEDGLFDMPDEQSADEHRPVNNGAADEPADMDNLFEPDGPVPDDAADQSLTRKSQA